MQKTVAEYFEQSSRDTRSRMAVHYEPEVKEFVRLTSALITLLGRFHAAKPQYDKERPYHAAFGLMTKGANTLGAAFELSLSGYLWEPPALLRVALETFAVAWDIVHNPKRFQTWVVDKKFNSTLSISNAKEVSDVIGKLNGLLSKMSIHISPLNSSPAMFQADQPKIQLFGLIQPGKESARRTEIYLSLFVTFICLQLTEITFYQYAECLETIQILPDGTGAQTRVSETHKVFVDEMKSVFRLLTEGKVEW